VPLPPEPATASLVYRIDQPLPPGVSMDFTPILPPDALQVGDPISRLSRAGIQSRTPRLRVHLKLTASAGAAGYSGTFTAGWWQPTTTLAYRAAQVRFDTLDIKAKHRSVGSQASWWLWVQAGDQWLDANANPALHAIPPGISAESVTLGLSTAPFFVLDPSTAGTLGSLYQDGFPKTCLSAGITNTGWRSGDLDANFGCSTCLTSLDKNASLGTVVLTLAEGSTGSVPVPAAGSYLFGPLLTDPPGNVDNPPPDARGDLALWGAVTTLKVYPAGLRNPLAH